LRIKFIFALILFSIFSLYTSAQSFELGLRGGAGNTWLFNNNVSNAGSEQNYALSFSYNYGLFLGYDINHRYTLELDVLSEIFTQKYSGKFIDTGMLPQGTYYVPGETYKSQTQLNIIAIPLLLHYNTRSGFNIELGPEYQAVNGAIYSSTYSNPLSNASYDVASAFAKSDMLIVLGFGWNLKLARSNFHPFINIRFTYGLSDLDGVDAFGQDLANNNTGKLYSGVHPYYPGYQATHSLEGSLNMGLFYRFAKHYDGSRPASRGRVY
jgi:Outer membrane protein beta-barrel domain